MTVYTSWCGFGWFRCPAASVEKTRAFGWRPVLVSHQVTGKEIKKRKTVWATNTWVQIFNLRRLRVALKEKNSCEETLELEANTDCSVFIPPTSPGFISHLRVCWCAEREAASAAGGDKARCCGCGGGWSCLPVAEGALSSLQAAALHCVPRCCVNTRPESPASCTRTRGHQLNVHAHLKRFSHFLKQLLTEILHLFYFQRWINPDLVLWWVFGSRCVFRRNVRCWFECFRWFWF